MITRIFDDTYEHEAWNDTDGERMVGFLDVLPPLRPPAHLANRALMTAVVAGIEARHAAGRSCWWSTQMQRTHVPGGDAVLPGMGRGNSS